MEVYIIFGYVSATGVFAEILSHSSNGEMFT